MGDDRRYAQVAVESIQSWAETVGVSDLGHEIARNVASDSTYRLHQVLHTCGQLLRYSKRRRLTTDDFNRALKWMDVPTVHGYSGNETIDWVSIPEVGVHVPHDPPVNLASTALSGDIFHQPGSPCVRGEWCHISSHVVKNETGGGNDCGISPLPLSSEHAQYYHTLFNTITRPSNTQFKIMHKDLSTSSRIGPLVGPIVGGLIRAVQRARQKPHILRRLLLTTQSLLDNPHIHVGPQNYMRDIVDGVLIYCIVTERKNPNDTQIVRSLAANILLKVIGSEAELGVAWETSVSNLGGVIVNNTQRWGQHVGSLLGLLTLGPVALHQALVPCANTYYNRIKMAMSSTSKDGLDAHTASGLLLAGLVNITVGFVKLLPKYFEVSANGSKCESRVLNENVGDQNSEDICDEELGKNIIEVYHMSEAMYGPAYVLQVPSLYLCFKKEDCPTFMSSSLYKEQAVTGETLLREMMNSPPPPPKRQRTSYKPKVPTMSSHKRVHISPLQIFDSYRQVIPRQNRCLPISMRGCRMWSLGQLKRKSSTLPRVSTNTKMSFLPHKQTGRMPHATFTRPLNPPLKGGYSLNSLIL